MNANARTGLAGSSVLLALAVGVLALLAAGCSGSTPEPADESGGVWEVSIPLGLGDDLLIPADNPLTREKVDLGRFLYYDPRLSAAGDVSCATCHHPDHGFGDGAPVSTGHEGQKGGRSAPTVINSTFSYLQFWDGRAASLEEQALGPIENPIEMANTVDGMVATVNGIPGYAPLFEAAFGDPEITPDRVAKAIASFERTVLSGNSAWDRFMAGDENAMTEEQKRGWELFKDKAQCTLCHAGQTFSDSDFHNLGVGMAAKEPDLGRYVVTENDADRGAFKTPPLRDITKTAPYMHDGSQATLLEVMEFYNKGGEPNDWLSDKIVPLELTEQEIQDVVAFLEALDGEIPNDVSEPESLP
jgi:cytochrome c peroxidase